MQPDSPSISARAPHSSIQRLSFRRVRNAAVKWSLSPCARSVMKNGLTYLSPQKLRVIERCVKRLDREGIRGDFIECGVALGGSAILLSTLLSPGRSFHGYDVFEMIPPPGPQDEPYYGYMTNLQEVVVRNFSKFGQVVDGKRICLHRGLFENTLQFAAGSQVALAHIDCDWYDPVRLCLERIHERLAVGGCMILDDYNDFRGCRKAADGFLAEKPDLELVATAPNAIIRRIAVQ